MPATSHQMGSPMPIVSAKPTMKPSAAESKVPRTQRVSVPVVVESKSIRHRIALPARNEGGSASRLLPFDKCPAMWTHLVVRRYVPAAVRAHELGLGLLGHLAGVHRGLGRFQRGALWTDRLQVVQVRVQTREGHHQSNPCNNPSHT